MVPQGKKLLRVDRQQMETAVKSVIQDKFSIRKASQTYNISKSALHRAVNSALRLTDPKNFEHTPNIGNRRVFTTQQEACLVDYLITASKMCYGLGHAALRKLAYQYAKGLNIPYPEKWDTDLKASIDWLKGFKKRHKKSLSLRKPEKTSLSRATAFNTTTVNSFFNNLESVMNKFHFTPDNIYNCDETGLTTVTDPPKVFSQKGLKQVGQATSAERGSLVTMLTFISATGNTIPPVFVFPRVHFKEFMLHGAPTGSLGVANKSGWMTEINFLEAFKHFVKHSKPSPESPVLLLLDNHESHISLNVVNYAKTNNVVLLTFPPHTSHRLQPLDVALYGPFKTYFKSAQNEWMLSNAGKTLDIYNIASLSNKAYINAFNQKNIISGFSSTGIYPLDRNIFDSSDFLCSFVTDHGDPTKKLPSDSAHPEAVPCTSDIQTAVTPEAIRPFPKAPERKNTKNIGRKRGSTRVLTDTGEKRILEEAHNEKLRKMNITKKSNKTVRKILYETSSSESEDENMKFIDTDDDISENFNTDEDCTSDFSIEGTSVLEENDFVLVDCSTKKNKLCYIGHIQLKLDNQELQIKFLRRFGNSNRFYYPLKEDISDVERQRVKKKLKPPNRNCGTKRSQEIIYFSISFENYERQFGRIL